MLADRAAFTFLARAVRCIRKKGESQGDIAVALGAALNMARVQSRDVRKIEGERKQREQRTTPLQLVVRTDLGSAAFFAGRLLALRRASDNEWESVGTCTCTCTCVTH